MIMAEKLGLKDGKSYELKLGKSFQSGSGVAFHSMRYDFKPASVDQAKMGAVEIKEKNSVSVTVPHVEGAGTTHTTYKGNKRSLQKECVLIIDHKTGEITLEKLASNIQLKKTRDEGGCKAACLDRPVVPIPEKTRDLKALKKAQKGRPASTPPAPASASPTHTKQTSHTHNTTPAAAPSRQKPAPPTSSTTHSPRVTTTTTTTTPAAAATSAASAASAAATPSIPASTISDVGVMSDSSSDSDSSSNSDSDSDSDVDVINKSVSPPLGNGGSQQPPATTAMLCDDLQLSESGSDSD